MDEIVEQVREDINTESSEDDFIEQKDNKQSLKSYKIITQSDLH